MSSSFLVSWYLLYSVKSKCGGMPALRLWKSLLLVTHQLTHPVWDFSWVFYGCCTVIWISFYFRISFYLFSFTGVCSEIFCSSILLTLRFNFLVTLLCGIWVRGISEQVSFLIHSNQWVAFFGSFLFVFLFFVFLLFFFSVFCIWLFPVRTSLTFSIIFINSKKSFNLNIENF